MTLTEFADVIGRDLLLTYYANQGERYCCRFERGEVLEGRMLIGMHGNGPSPGAAMRDYAERIAGKTLAFNAHASERREFHAPAKFDEAP